MGLRILLWQYVGSIMEREQQDTMPSHTDHEGMFEIGDLQPFSMNTVSDALGKSGISHGHAPNSDLVHRLNDRGEDSDCSWTQEDDSGRSYFDLRRQLDTFALAEDQSNMTTAFLSRPQRHFVHATAQLMRLGHASLGGQAKYRQMVIYKPNTSPQTLIHNQSYADSRNLNARSAISADDALCAESARSRKRKRVPKVDGGFPCQFQGCGKPFDRASERRKHEESHSVAFTNRFQCIQCDKAFRYPKDLRRHQKVHTNTTDQMASDLLGTSFGSTQNTSNMTLESRVASETSLTFSSKPTSNENSPFMVGVVAGVAPQIDIEPFVLGEAWTSGQYGLEAIEDEFGLPCQDLVGFGLNDNDGNEESFLEMAMTRK